MKRKYKVLIIAGLILAIILFFLRGSEDTWIKNENGEYIEHGTPSEVPDYVAEQQTAIIEALQLYQEKKQQGMRFSSQCLGVVGDNIRYAVDIVHVPRNKEDDFIKNQCEDYLDGKIKNFIELDNEGNIVRII